MEQRDSDLFLIQMSHVIIGDRVSLGANVCVDKGALEPTVIGDGVKIDNHVQVGHGVNIGRNTIISGCTAIGGSTKIGERCMVGGSTSISDHIEIGNGVIISGLGAVMRSIFKPGVYASFFQVQPVKNWMKNLVYFNNLSKYMSQLKQKDIS